MWRRAATAASAAALGRRPWLPSPCRHSSSSATAAVDSMVLRSLDEYCLKAFGISPPPASASSAVKFTLDRPFDELYGKVSDMGRSKMRFPPNYRYPVEFAHVATSLYKDEYPVLRRTCNDEEICVFAYRKRGRDFGKEHAIDRMRLHVRVSKPQQDDLYFACMLYPKSLRILSVSVPMASSVPPPPFEELDEKLRNALRSYIEERGINESLFPFLQKWLYFKDQWKLLQWLKVVAALISLKEEDLPKEATL